MKELVIKIPEKEYKNICLMSKDGIGMALYDWIANGTPLPKNHGRLIDADDIINDIKNDINEMTNLGLAVTRDYLWEKINDAIYNAPTIIEWSESK